MFSRDQVLALMRERVHHPAGMRELLQTLKIPRDDRTSFKRHIKTLVASGDLIQIRGHRFGLPEKMDLYVGRLQTHRAGYGFVTPERPLEAGGDIYISGPHLNEAMHGDRVVVRIERIKEGGRAEGRIIRILERRNESIVGRYDRDDPSRAESRDSSRAESRGHGMGYVVPFDRRVLMDIFIPPGQEGGASPGDMVVVELTRWPTATRGAIGHVAEVLGDIDAPGVDTEIIIRKYGIPDAHSDEAVTEAVRLGGSVSERDLRGRTDFRGVTTVTIDGEHARDFDDAITIEKLPNGHFWLGVHIADVSHYVQEGSALDREAYERGTSVYFPERAVHMFPSELATGLCSLNPHVDRLVQSCLMEVDRHGQVVRYEFHDGVINSTERMTYTAVNGILTDRDPQLMKRYAALVPMFEQMRELFQILNDARRRRGSIDFDLNEAEVIMDEAGRVEAITALERNVAHRLIEEFMLLANETVASYLEAQSAPALYRIHEEPDILKVEKFEEFISGFGYSLAAPIGALRPRHFQKLIERIHGKPEEKPIAFLMLRTMQKARYAPENLGHFGLAASSYTHFTSPIRRYPDLVVHRALRAARHGSLTGRGAGAPGVDEDIREEQMEELPEVARHTSEMERRADDAERELLQWKKVKFMADKVGDEFEGYVTGVAAFGLFIELIEHFVEGLVHVSTMADDYYRFVESAHLLRGENTHKVYRLGDKVKVQVIRVNMEVRQVDLGLVEILDRVREGERGPRRSRATPRFEKKRKQRPGRSERQVRKRGRR
ncbi:MAG TPA: ribonuclease R [Vicinamibacterales bacterium]|jgi:ribonuclease R|nr:ribonuclease R [Vicinamibacterales bacterium]